MLRILFYFNYRKNNSTNLPDETCRKRGRNWWKRPTASANQNHSWTCAANNHLAGSAQRMRTKKPQWNQLALITVTQVITQLQLASYNSSQMTRCGYDWEKYQFWDADKNWEWLRWHYLIWKWIPNIQANNQQSSQLKVGISLSFNLLKRPKHLNVF